MVTETMITAVAAKENFIKANDQCQKNYKKNFSSPGIKNHRKKRKTMIRLYTQTNHLSALSYY